MQWDIISLILGIFVIILGLSAAFTFLGTHLNNGLCENRFTFSLQSYTDYGEGVDYPAWLSDCCYDESRASSVCNSYESVMEEDLNCENEGKDNPANLFSCVDSTKLCNDDVCVQSCNNDGICKRDLGEGYWCSDCQ